MNRLASLLLATLSLACTSFRGVTAQPPPPAEPLPLTPSPAGIHDAELRDLGNGEWEVRTTGSDPYLFLRTGGTPIYLKTHPIFSFESFCPSEIGRMLVYVGPILDRPHLIVVAKLQHNDGWSAQSIELTATAQPPADPVNSLRVTLGERAGLIIHLRSLWARAPTAAEARLAAAHAESIESDDRHAERLMAYLQRSFPSAITSVTADASTIEIAGTVNPVTGQCALAEVPMWEDVTALTAPASLQTIIPDRDGHFSIRVSRDSASDREPLLSGWVIAHQVTQAWEPLSAVHYVDDQKPRAPWPAAQPRSRKGLCGCPFDQLDITELGIASVTINVVLNTIIAAEPGPGRTPFQYLGRTWYSQDGVVDGYDREMKAAAKKGLVVSAIILVTPPHDAPAGTWVRDAAHPDADAGGLYVMPNFTSQAGVTAYAAALNFLAERYSQADGKYGRIHHWILHNEVNSGFYWTNAGTKTLITYLDLYHKSLRLACILSHQYDPNAKVLASLDHYWTSHPEVRSYPGRDLLERLVDFSRKEGDFSWGIAFHPYAQDLFNPRTWEDRDVTFDYETPLITFRNIEVLDAWASQPRVAFRGQPREIQFTEQGLNSRDYSEKSLAEQAAGLAYAWKKIEPLRCVTAFQYHVWTDNHGEGGLRLGLRKFSDDPLDPHGRKPAWDLYRDLGTDAEDDAARFALPIIGIKDWKSIRHTGSIQTTDSEPSGRP